MMRPPLTSPARRPATMLADSGPRHRLAISARDKRSPMAAARAGPDAVTCLATLLSTRTMRGRPSACSAQRTARVCEITVPRRQAGRFATHDGFRPGVCGATAPAGARSRCYRRGRSCADTARDWPWSPLEWPSWLPGSSFTSLLVYSGSPGTVPPRGQPPNGWGSRRDTLVRFWFGWQFESSLFGGGRGGAVSVPVSACRQRRGAAGGTAR